MTRCKNDTRYQCKFRKLKDYAFINQERSLFLEMFLFMAFGTSAVKFMGHKLQNRYFLSVDRAFAGDQPLFICCKHLQINHVDVFYWIESSTVHSPA